MIDPEAYGPHQQFANDLSMLMEQRLDASQPVGLLSDRGGKVLQVMREPDGRQFVLRAYSPGGVHEIETDSGISFADSWDCMQAIYAGAGIAIIPSSVLRDGSDYDQDHPAVIISEFLPDARSLSDASTETKVELAQKLPDLFAGSRDMLLSPEGLQHGMFHMTQAEDGREIVLMTDVDPLLLRKPRFGYDSHVANYIDTFSQLFWDEWCRKDERRKVLVAFVTACGQVLGDKLDDFKGPIMEAFSNAHLMYQGIDSRELPSQNR